jgi:hypothetical protein
MVSEIGLDRCGSCYWNFPKRLARAAASQLKNLLLASRPIIVRINITVIKQKRNSQDQITYRVNDQDRVIGETDRKDRALLWDRPWRVSIRNGIVSAEKRQSNPRSPFVNRSGNS